MMAVYEAKLDAAVGAPKLDRFTASEGAIPDDAFVVTRTRSGEPRSVFGDLVWDCSAYTPEGKGLSLVFTYWGSGVPTEQQLVLSREIRCVIFAMIWKRDGARLAPKTLSNFVTVVSALAKHAEERGTTVFNMLGDEAVLADFVNSGCGGWMAETLGTLLGNLSKMSSEQLGFALIGSKAIAVIKRLNKAYRARLKQHAPMPTRIYLHFIQGLLSEREAWLKVSGQLLETMMACGANPRMGRTVGQQRFIARKLDLEHKRLSTFEQLVDAEGVDYFFARGKRADVKSLSCLVQEVQVVCKLLIQTFSGMREDEAASLPYDCLETHTVDGRVRYIIKGRTTKFNHGNAKRTRWVTNREGFLAIQTAQAIADALYAIHDIEPGEAGKRTSSHPLFVSVAYAALVGKVRKPLDGHFVPGSLTIYGDSQLPERLCTRIFAEDLRELEHIDPFRAWTSEEKFSKDRRWTFTSHQLRRSLALYAQRSGLVSLPSLRRQLQHLTEDMSRYYAKGSEFAKGFIGADKDHFGKEWQATQGESAGLSYILNVLLTGDKLIGGHAHWVAHRAKGPDGALLGDRQATMRRFKKGEMAYQETPIGGCTNTKACDQPVLNVLHVECIRDNCKSLVCSLPKLQRVINAQQRMVESLDPATVEYRTEQADLDVLIAARDAALCE